MKKFQMKVTNVFSPAAKTVDADYDEKHTSIKGVDKAISDYTIAVNRMRDAARGMSSALDNIAKAFEGMTANEDTPESMKNIAKTCSEAAEKIRDNDLADYVKALEAEVVQPVKAIKDKIKELTAVEHERNKVMADYDMFREAVDKKEKEYEKKGKDISGSKNYEEEKNKRDELKGTFETEDKKYKEMAEAVNKERVETFLKSMQELSSGTSTYFTGVEKKIVEIHTASKKAKL